MSSHAAVADLSQLPGAQDDPNSFQSGYWMLLCFVFTAFSIFAGAWLALEMMEQTAEDPAHISEDGVLSGTWDDQRADLGVTLKGDLLTLKDGTVLDEGVVVQFSTTKDDKVQEWVAIKNTRYALDRERAIRELLEDKPGMTRGKAEARIVELAVLDNGKNNAIKEGKELKFTPSEVDMASIQKGRGKGKTLCVPIEQGLRLYLQDRSK